MKSLDFSDQSAVGPMLTQPFPVSIRPLTKLLSRLVAHRELKPEPAFVFQDGVIANVAMKSAQMRNRDCQKRLLTVLADNVVGGASHDWSGKECR